MQRQVDGEAALDNAVDETGARILDRAALVGGIEQELVRRDRVDDLVDGDAGAAGDRVAQREIDVGAEELAGRGAGPRPRAPCIGGDAEEAEARLGCDVVLEQASRRRTSRPGEEGIGLAALDSLLPAAGEPVDGAIARIELLEANV